MIVGVIILFISSISFFVMGVRSLKEKGFLFNNAYIYASKQERETMNKAPHYRQTGIVFLLIGILFLLNGFDLLFETGWMFYIVIMMIIITLIYAIVSSVLIEKKNKRK